MPITINGNGALAGVSPTLSGFGKVIQIVTANKTTQVTGTGAVAVGATITPTSSANKIIVVSNVHRLTFPPSAADYNHNEGLYRGATKIMGIQLQLVFTNLSQGSRENTTHIWVDTPASTSALTYEWRLDSGANQVYFNTNGTEFGSSTILLVEFAA